MLKLKYSFLLSIYSCILCISALTLSSCSSGDDSPNAPINPDLQEEIFSSATQNPESSSSKKDKELSSKGMTIEQSSSSSEITEKSCSSILQKPPSSSSKNNQELSSNGTAIEQSSSSESVEKKSKFVCSEIQFYTDAISQGSLYLSSIRKYLNYIILSDTSESYETEYISYNADGTISGISSGKFFVNGLKKQSYGEGISYKYIDGEQKIAGTTNWEEETIVDKNTPLTIYWHSKTKTIVDGEQSEYESSYTYTIEFLGSTEEGSEYKYKYITDQNGKEFNTNTKYILDRDGFIKKIISYDDSNNISGITVYSGLPNAPNELYNLYLCSTFYDESSSYEHNVSCKDIVNTQDIYQVEIKQSYKLKNSDQEYNSSKYIYTYKRIFY